MDNKTIISFLEQVCVHSADKTAFVFLADGTHEKDKLTYAQLKDKALAVASYLQQNARAGDVIILSYLPGLDFIIAFIGCLYAGMTAVCAYPLRSNRHAQRLLAMLDDCKPSIILGTADSLALMQAQPEFSSYHYFFTEDIDESLRFTYKEIAIKSDDLAFLQYTSGSTGTPKGVMINHKNILTNVRMIEHFFQLTREDKFVLWLPLQHDMGLISSLCMIYCGMSEIILPPTVFLENPLCWLHAIDNYKASISGGANFGYQLCIDKIKDESLVDLDLRCWRVAFNGSEPVRYKTIHDFTEKLRPHGFNERSFLPCYGMAETTLLVSGKPHGESIVKTTINKNLLEQNIIDAQEDGAYYVSSGHIDPSYTMRIVIPETLKIAKDKEVGEIWLNGPSVAQGYWNKADETQRVFAAQLPGDNNHYLRTGDLGFLDGEELYITGRLKDLIIIQGRNIYPQDVEHAAECCHPAIRKGCTAAFSVEINNQEKLILVAEIERTHRKMDCAALLKLMRQAVVDAVNVVPQSIVLLGPAKAMRTTSGKIQRSATKQAYLNGSLEALAATDLPVSTGGSDADFLDKYHLAPPHEKQQLLEHFLIDELKKILNIDEINKEDGFFSLGIDSLMTAELAFRLSDLFPAITFNSRVLFEYPTLAALQSYIETQLELTQEEKPEDELADTHATTFPLNFPLFVLKQYGGSFTHTVSFSMKTKERIPTQTLAEHCRAVVCEHPILWHFFDTKYPLMHFNNIDHAWTPEIIDLSHFDKHAQEEQLNALFKKHIHHNSWVAHSAPLLKLIIIELSEGLHEIQWHISHAVFDGFSISLLTHDLLHKLNKTEAAPKGLNKLPLKKVATSEKTQIQALFPYSEANKNNFIKAQEYINDIMKYATHYYPVDKFVDKKLQKNTFSITIDNALPIIKNISKRKNYTQKEVLFALFCLTILKCANNESLLVGNTINARMATEDYTFGFRIKSAYVPVVFAADINTTFDLVIAYQRKIHALPLEGILLDIEVIVFIRKYQNTLWYRTLYKAIKQTLFVKAVHDLYPEEALDDYIGFIIFSWNSRIKNTVFSRKKRHINFRYNDLVTPNNCNAILDVFSRKSGLVNPNTPGRCTVLPRMEDNEVSFSFVNYPADWVAFEKKFLAHCAQVLNELDKP